MSNRDTLSPNYIHQSSDNHALTSTVYSASHLNPVARNFHPSNDRLENSSSPHTFQTHNITAEHSATSQVSSTSPTYIMDRIESLERSHGILRNNVEHLETMYTRLDSDIELLRTSDWAVQVGPIQSQGRFQSREPEDFCERLEMQKATLGVDTDPKDSGNAASGEQQAKLATSIPNNVSLPPYLRNNSSSLPPHLRDAQSKERRHSTPKVDQNKGHNSSESRIAVARG